MKHLGIFLDFPVKNLKGYFTYVQEGKRLIFQPHLLALLKESVQREKLSSELCNAYVCNGCSSSTARSKAEKEAKMNVQDVGSKEST